MGFVCPCRSESTARYEQVKLLPVGTMNETLVHKEIGITACTEPADGRLPPTRPELAPKSMPVPPYVTCCSAIPVTGSSANTCE